MKEKIFYKRRDYEAVADAPQSKIIKRKTSQILSPSDKGKCTNFNTLSDKNCK